MDTRGEFDRRIGWVMGLAVALIGTSTYAGYRLQQEHFMTRVQSQIAGWPAGPRLAAGVVLEKYGPPDRSGARGGLIWFRRGPWKRIVVHEDERNLPLEQVVDYDVKPQSLEALRAFGHGVIVDPNHSELSASSDREPLNFLALNLAEELASGSRDLQQAERVYAKTADLEHSGKSSAYTQGLLFEDREPIAPLWVKGLKY